MASVAEGFFTISVVIALGAALAHLGILDLHGQRILSQVAFFVGGPALMLTLMARTDVAAVFSGTLAATALGLLVPAVAYAVVAARRRDGLGEGVIGTMCAGYVNAGNLGIPIATYVLGDPALVAPVLVLQLGFLQPLALVLLDLDGDAGRHWRRLLLRPVTNPMTVATFTGIVLSVTGTSLPALIQAPAELLGGLAVPTMLLVYGVSLRLGPGLGDGLRSPRVLYATTLKLVVHPAATYGICLLLGLGPAATLAATVCAALPSAQNIFTHAVRYHRAVQLARDTILLTTIGAAPAVLLIALLLH